MNNLSKIVAGVSLASFVGLSAIACGGRGEVNSDILNEHPTLPRYFDEFQYKVVVQSQKYGHTYYTDGEPVRDGIWLRFPDAVYEDAKDDIYIGPGLIISSVRDTVRIEPQ